MSGLPFTDPDRCSSTINGRRCALTRGHGGFHEHHELTESFAISTGPYIAFHWADEETPLVRPLSSPLTKQGDD